MAENFEISPQESIAETEPNLSELKKQVEITPSTLKDITNREQFLERVIQLSNNAKESINYDRAKEALVYLTQAEKILQYAASCGKTIDKYIIISVLHNEACCYQKIWQLQKCSQYLEALIFNFNSFMKPREHSSNSDDSSGKSNKQKSVEDTTAQTIDRKTFLAKYYLQFCAVNSQTDNHSGALVAGRKSIEILKSIFSELACQASTLKKATYQKKSEFEYKLRLIELASRINDSVNIQNYDHVFQAAKYYLRQWKMMKDNKDRPERNYVLEQEFKNYSIGNAMQIVPMTYKEFQQRDTKNYSAKIILEKILLMALGYFTISTELRLIAGKKQSKREGDKGHSYQNKQSEIYHLLSIIISSACIPFEILYIKHVLSSYSNHYGNDLLIEAQHDSRLKDIKFQELIFPPISTLPRKITVNHSFTASLEHEQTISKFQKEDNDQIFSSNETQTDKKKEDPNRQDEAQATKNQFAKKVKHSHKNKSKSKTKHLKSITFLGLGERSEKVSPMPKSPNTHMKSPKNQLIKVKTSYKLKVSTEKIMTSNNLLKEEKSKKKKEVRADNINFDYFMGRSKDLKKLKKTVETGLNLPSPRPGVTSKSSSKRESPTPKYFEQLKPQSPVMKSIKSPRKSGLKMVKNSLQQHYL